MNGRLNLWGLENKRWMSALLIIVLVAALIPPLNQTVHAATSLQIQNWVTSDVQPTNPSLVTTRMVDITVDYSQINDEDLVQLYYEITDMSSDSDNRVTKVVEDNPAVKIGTNRAVFRDVELAEGLNKITVIQNSVSKPQSLPAWINFTAVTTISDLTVNDNLFTNGSFVPESNPTPGLNSVFVNGIAPNATEVRGFTTLNPTGAVANFFFPETGEFSFSAGEDDADLLLQAGDNDLKILASNPTKSYKAERNFIYNNGGAFFYNTLAVASVGSQLNDPVNTMLYKQPTYEASGTLGPFEVDISTNAKINRAAGNMTHNIIDLEVNNSSIVYQVAFSNLDEAAGTVDHSVDGGAVTALNVQVEDDYYLIEGLKLEGVVIDTSKSTQNLEITYVAIPGFNNETQDFTFFYVNNQEPFVDEVRFEGKSVV